LQEDLTSAARGHELVLASPAATNGLATMTKIRVALGSFRRQWKPVERHIKMITTRRAQAVMPRRLDQQPRVGVQAIAEANDWPAYRESPLMERKRSLGSQLCLCLIVSLPSHTGR